MITKIKTWLSRILIRGNLNDKIFQRTTNYYYSSTIVWSICTARKISIYTSFCQCINIYRIFKIFYSGDGEYLYKVLSAAKPKNLRVRVQGHSAYFCDFYVESNGNVWVQDENGQSIIKFGSELRI